MDAYYEQIKNKEENKKKKAFLNNLLNKQIYGIIKEKRSKNDRIQYAKL